jgi:heavy metal sensor kinase
MYLGMRRAIQRSVDRQLDQRTADMRQFMWRHRSHSLAEMPGEFYKSSGVQPGEELYQIVGPSGAWLYQAPSMQQLNIPGRPPNPQHPAQYETISRRYVSIRVLSTTVEVSGQYYLVQVGTVLTPLYLVLNGFITIALVTLPFVLLAAGAAGYWLSGRAMKPVHHIVSDAREISEQSLSRRLDVPAANDELRQLSETLNEMLARLDAAFTRITQFTADASHELRTPITTIRTTAEVILERHRSVEEYEEMVRQILAESEVTSELIDNLLTLARADASPGQLEVALVDIRSVVDEILPGSKILATYHGLEFSASVESSQILVLANTQSLKRLLLILVDNAIKYTPRGGTVRLALRSTAGHAVMEVIDSGIGITAEERPYIFDRFYRASNARYLNADGSGLGLAIAQWVAGAHHGSLEALPGSGNGTTLRLTLPLHLGSAAL